METCVRQSSKVLTLSDSGEGIIEVQFVDPPHQSRIAV